MSSSAWPVHRSALGDLVRTAGGSVTASFVVLACNGYLGNLERRVAGKIMPINNFMIATEPLPDDVWESIGLHDRPTFHDYRNALIYGQRTADGRFAFGGRGAVGAVLGRSSLNRSANPANASRAAGGLAERSS